jgi:molybdopterin-biosynthesis enzyme MoeA-like protein
MANPKFAFHTGRTATTLERPKLSMDEMKEMAKQYGVAMSENQSRMATMPDSPDAYI